MQATLQPAQNTTEPDGNPDASAPTTTAPDVEESSDGDDKTMIYVGVAVAAAVVIAAVGAVLLYRRCNARKPSDLTVAEEDQLAAMQMQAEFPEDMVLLDLEGEEVDGVSQYQLAM